MVRGLFLSRFFLSFLKMRELGSYSSGLFVYLYAQISHQQDSASFGQKMYV